MSQKPRVEHPSHCMLPLGLPNCPKWMDYLENFKGKGSIAETGMSAFYMESCFNQCAFNKDTQSSSHGEEWEIKASLILGKKLEEFPTLKDQLKKVDKIIKRINPSIGLKSVETIAVVMHFTSVIQQLIAENKNETQQ